MQSCLELIPDDIERAYLAYSGGLDSSVLLHLLANSEAAFSVQPWHINHGLLDSASQMEEFCIEQARRYGLDLRVDRLRLGELESNFEAEARRQRYRLFESAVGERECMLTAHHADDQAETVLLNALRGSGSAGLRGIARRRALGRGLLLRPLLDYSRQQLEDYAARHEIAWFNDPSNRNNRFDRNYLRNEVMPAIRARWPGYLAALATTGRQQAETQRLLDEIAALDHRSLAQPAKAGDPTLDLDGLLALSAERCRNLLRYWVRQAGLAAIPGARLDDLMRQLHARRDAMPKIASPGYSIRLYDRRLFLVRDGGLRDCRGAYRFGLEPVIEIEAFGLRTRRAEIFRQLGVADRNQRVTLRYRRDGRQDGDRHRLKRLFQQQRVPPWERDCVPQVYLDGELAGLLR
jgi:tRNA(Ile)-lysidine synthase